MVKSCVGRRNPCQPHFLVLLVYATILVRQQTVEGLLHLFENISHQKEAVICIITCVFVDKYKLVYLYLGREYESNGGSKPGYYINPLVSVLLGVFILKESLSKAQIVSFGLAAIGVLILTISYGEFPWIAIGLAFSFGLYGLAKKMIKVESSIGLTLETMTIAPISLIYLGYMFNEGSLSLFHVSLGTDLLLMGAGAVTAIPLLFFSKGAQMIPLYMVGFLQYIAPTITLILGIWVYHEAFSFTHLISFMFIWLALTIFTASRVQYARKRRREARLSA